MKFYLITGAIAAIIFGSGYFIGWGQGRTKFTNECITIGNFTVFDYGTDKQRRFKCAEAPFDNKPLPDNSKTSL